MKFDAAFFTSIFVVCEDLTFKAYTKFSFPDCAKVMTDITFVIKHFGLKLTHEGNGSMILGQVGHKFDRKYR